MSTPLTSCAHTRHRAGCNSCRRRSRAYDVRRRRMIADGTWQPPVPAETVIGHIEHLQRGRMNLRAIARAANVPIPTVYTIMYNPRTTVVGPTAARLLAVQPQPTPPSGYVLPHGATRRVQAMIVAGYTMTYLGGRLGQPTPQICRRLVWGRVEYVSDRTHQMIADLFEELAGTVGPSKRAQTLGTRNGWLPSDAWNNIDDPDAEPWASGDFVDAVRVDKALAGEAVPLSPAEQHHAVLVGISRGLSLSAISDRIHVSYDRAKRLAAKPLPAGYELVA